MSTAERSPAVPDLPTVTESGVPGFEVSAWFGLMAPAGTPREIVDKLHAESVKAIRQPDVTERLTGEGARIVAGTPEQFDAFVASELDKWATVAKAAGARAD